MHQLITKDPVSGGELIVTRLECPDSGIVIEGQFSLGWIGRLSREQLDFVEMLVKYRGNIRMLPTILRAAAWTKLLPRLVAHLKTMDVLIAAPFSTALPLKRSA